MLSINIKKNITNDHYSNCKGITIYENYSLKRYIKFTQLSELSWAQIKKSYVMFKTKKWESRRQITLYKSNIYVS